MSTTTYKETEIGTIPDEWEVVRLGDDAISNLIMGQSPSSESYNLNQNGLPFFQGKAEFGNIYPVTVKWCSSPQRIAEPNDILISVRAPVGDVNIAPFKCCIGRGLAAIRAKCKSDSSFLFFLFLKEKARLSSLGSGSIFQSINKDILRFFPIPFPPLDEQKKIAAVLSKIQQAIEVQEKIIACTKELKKSLMTKLFTEGLHGERQQETEIGLIPESWEVKELGSLVRKKITDGTHVTPVYQNKGIKFVSATNLRNGEIDFENCKLISQNEHERLTKRCKPEQDDILLSKVGTLGLVAKIEQIEEFSIFVQVALIKPKTDLIDSDFLKYILSSDTMQSQILQKSSTSTMKYIGVGKIAHLEIPVPSMVEQKEIGNILIALDSNIKNSQMHTFLMQSAFKSMLHQLMTGKTRVKDLELN